jgi:hypothetical protein
MEIPTAVFVHDTTGIPMSTIPGMTEATFENWYGYPSHKDPDPFIALLPALTADMQSADGPLSEYCPGYAWADKARFALNSILGPEIRILSGDDSGAPGAAPTGDPASWPGIYTPAVSPSGGGFTSVVNGMTYRNLCFRVSVTPATGKPYLVDGFNVTLAVRQFLQEPNGIPNVLAHWQVDILGRTSHTPLA